MRQKEGAEFVLAAVKADNIELLVTFGIGANVSAAFILSDTSIPAALKPHACYLPPVLWHGIYIHPLFCKI